MCVLEPSHNYVGIAFVALPRTKDYKKVQEVKIIQKGIIQGHCKQPKCLLPQFNKSVVVSSGADIKKETNNLVDTANK